MKEIEVAHLSSNFEFVACFAGRSVCLRAQTKLRTLLQEFKLFYFLTQSEAKWEDWSF